MLDSVVKSWQSSRFLWQPRLHFLSAVLVSSGVLAFFPINSSKQACRSIFLFSVPLLSWKRLLSLVFKSRDFETVTPPFHSRSRKCLDTTHPPWAAGPFMQENNKEMVPLLLLLWQCRGRRWLKPDTLAPCTCPSRFQSHPIEQQEGNCLYVNITNDDVITGLARFFTETLA